MRLTPFLTSALLPLLAALVLGLALGWLSAKTSRRHGRWRRRVPTKTAEEWFRQWRNARKEAA